MARKKIDTSVDMNNNAAATFIKPTEKKAEKAPAKDKRVQLLFVPEEWAAFEDFAHLAGQSTNQSLNQLVHDTITKYDKQIAMYQRKRDELLTALEKQRTGEDANE